MSVYDFHAMYAAHNTPMADMSATISDKISYNDNHASPPYVFKFGGFGSPPTVKVAPSLKCSTVFFYKSIHISGGVRGLVVKKS